MRTQGITIGEGGGYLILQAGSGSIPPPFWSRLKHAITKAGLLDEFAAAYRADCDAIRESRKAGTSRLDVELAAEDRLFRVWVWRLFGSGFDRWPWQGGWTQSEVDAYLTTAEARAA